MTQHKDDYFSKTLFNGLRVLELFSPDRSEWSLAEITREVGLNKTSVYRLVNTLVKTDYLKKDARTRQLTVGVKAIALGHSFLQGFSMLHLVKPLVDEAFERYDVSISVGAVYEDLLFVVYRRMSTDVTLHAFPTMTRMWHCHAAGKAGLAFLPDDKRSALLEKLTLAPRTEKTITDPAQLLADLEKTKARGYALSDEEWGAGHIGVAAPLINLNTGQLIGSVNFASTTAKYSIDGLEEKYAGPVVGFARELSNIIQFI